MNVTSKTPVSFLQELCTKRGITPTYQVINNESPSHMPTFIYEVTCNDHVTQGKGSSKKEAKHAAADKMLEILKNCPEFNFDANTNEAPIPENTAIPSPYEGKLKVDAVGPLSDYCKEYDLPSPEYVTVREEGPAHAKMFTHRCFVHSFGVEATERTKKQAKQQVALQMITMLKNVIDPRVNRGTKGPTFTDSAAQEDFQKALSKFPDVQTTFNTKFQPKDLTHPIATNYTRYREYYGSMKELFDIQNVSEIENPEEVLGLVLRKAEINYSFIPIDSDDPQVFIAVLNINFIPDLNVYQFGSSYVEVARKIAIKAIEFIRTFCSPEESKYYKEDYATFEDLISVHKTKLTS